VAVLGRAPPTSPGHCRRSASRSLMGGWCTATLAGWGRRVGERTADKDQRGTVQCADLLANSFSTPPSVPAFRQFLLPAALQTLPPHPTSRLPREHGCRVEPPAPDSSEIGSSLPPQLSCLTPTCIGPRCASASMRWTRQQRPPGTSTYWSPCPAGIWHPALQGRPWMVTSYVLGCTRRCRAPG